MVSLVSCALIIDLLLHHYVTGLIEREAADAQADRVCTLEY
jgi:hypothetical protein